MTINLKNAILVTCLAIALSSCGGAEERKAKYMEKGKAYFTEKNYEKAKIEFKNVMQIDPKFADAFFYMGRIEEAGNDLRKAAGNYNQAIQLDPDHLDAKARLARIFTLVATNDSLDQAKKLLQEIFSKNPDHLDAIMVQAILDLRADDKESAINKLKMVIEKDQTKIDAYSELAVIYTLDKNEEAAIELLKKGIEKNNDSVVLRATLAQLLARGRRDIAGAEVQARKIVELEPENYTFWVSLATLYATTGQNDKAEAVFREAIEKDKEDAQRYIVLVEYLAKKKSVKDAESELLGAINKMPNLYGLQFALAEFYQKLQMIDKSISVLTKISDVQKVSSDGLKAKSKLAEIYLAQGRIGESQKMLDVILAETPNSSDALLIKAKIAYMKQDDLTVINALRSVLKDEPKNHDAALLLAQAHVRNNESDLAKEVLMHIIEIDPVNPRNHLNYANFVASSNDIKKAEEVIDRALAYFKADYDLMQAKLRFAAARKDENTVNAVLEKMKQLFPDKEELRMQIGQYYVLRKQYPKALEEFEAALKLSITQLQPLEAIVKTYIAMGQEQKAIDRLQARLKTNADDPIGNHFLGQIAASHNENARALEYFKRSMKFGSWDAPFGAAASIYMKNRDYSSALLVLEEGAGKVANAAGLLMQLAAIYEQQKNYEKAISTYEKVLDANPANQMAANNLASLLLDFGQGGDSAKRALELTSGFAKSKHPALMDTLGWATLKNNDAAKAVGILEEVFRMAPEVGVFQYHLGMAYLQAGDTVNAKRYLAMAVASKQEYPGKDKAAEALARL